MDMAVVVDYRVKMKDKIYIKKKFLEQELKKLEKIRVRSMHLRIGAIVLEIQERVEIVQTTVMLGSVRILTIMSFSSQYLDRYSSNTRHLM